MPTPDLLDEAYADFRLIAGAALATGGLTLLISPLRDFVARRLGSLLLAAGFLFSLSVLDSEARIQVDLSNLLVIAALLVIGISLIDIMAYLFADEPPASLRLLKLAGLGWSFLIWLLPFVDYLSGSGPAVRSVEDGSLLAPLHAVASYAIYAWPLVVVAFLVPICRIDLRLVFRPKSDMRFFAAGALGLIASLGLALVGAWLGSRGIYRTGHCLLEALMLSWYFLAAARPSLFVRAREAIKEERERLVLNDPGEIAAIGERVRRAAADPEVIGRSDLDLRGLAEIVGVPPYVLSNWFNAREKTSFPAWLNARRVERVQALMLEHPGRLILDLAMEAGYASKSVFNEQFRRCSGMSPSAWRRSARAGEASSSGIPN